MPVTLQQIVALSRTRAAALAEGDRAELEHRAEAHTPRGFRNALSRHAASGIAVIAELKKASPSRGLIREPFHVTSLAVQLANAGAAALSVLTEEQHFQGSLANLCEASAATSIPCLRKDFIVDELQLLEARASRADAVLLIVAALSQRELVDLISRARQFNLDVLCEAHDADEIHRAVDAGADIIGVNSRDLRTMAVDPQRLVQLASLLPSSVLRVAESGIRSHHDILALRDAGYESFLVGETLMRADSPAAELQKLLGTASSAGGRP